VRETEAECETYRDCLRNLGEDDDDKEGEVAGSNLAEGRGGGDRGGSIMDEEEEEAALAAEVAQCEREEAAEVARAAVGLYKLNSVYP
jgi:hypothetical protein